MSERKITLVKWSQRSLDRKTMMKQLDYGVSRALAGSRGRVWRGVVRSLNEEEDQGGKKYTAVIKINRTGRQVNTDVAKAALDKIERLMERAVRGKGWTLNGSPPPSVREAGEPELLHHEEEKSAYAAFTFERVTGNRSEFFGHLYNVDAQIELVLSAVEEYQRSEFSNRFHCVLYGEPACGKTEILRSLSKMLGPDAVMHFDATSTTAAGAKQLLTESASIPPVLCIEEIEKADEQSLRWLLGVLDYRAEVRYLKHRAGLVSREVKLLCLATVNDFGLFKRMMDGALASRFSHKIYCPRPDRRVLGLILQREIKKSGGDPSWIEPALDYCMKVEGTNDPRRIITVCLCGKDKLLSGEYQATLKLTRPTDEQLAKAHRV